MTFRSGKCSRYFIFYSILFSLCCMRFKNSMDCGKFGSALALELFGSQPTLMAVPVATVKLINDLEVSIVFIDG